jgi:hypothetical protein
VVKLVLGLLDHLVGGRSVWLPVHGEVLIVERGWYDQLVDPIRYRLSLRSRPLIRALGRLLPRYDVAVVLGGDPAAIHARKPEIPLVELVRQISDWGRIAPRVARQIVIVDTTAHSAEECARVVVAALPGPRGPLTLYTAPLTPRRLELLATGARGSRHAMSVYRPMRLAARAAAAVSSSAVRARVARCAPAPFDIDQLMAALPERPTAVAVMSSQQTGRWVVGFADATGLRYVAKVGLPDDVRLVREVDCLTRLTGAGRVRVPHMVWNGELDRHIALVTQAVPRQRPKPLSDAHAVDIAVVVATGALGATRLHGDFAPWNVISDGREHWLLDWESSSDEFVPVADLAHYFVQRESLVHRRDAYSVVRLLRDPGGPGARYLATMELDWEDSRAGLAAYLEEWALSGPPNARFIRELSALLF